MTCLTPLKGYLSRDRTATGKRKVVFDSSAGYIDREIEVACGQCRGCRAERARTWQLRCIHEASERKENCFLTLTYDMHHLPPGRTLVKADLRKFMKRLRRRISPKKISFYAVGEYGDRFGRPHYHVLLFGHDFSDSVFHRYSEKGYALYRSRTLSALWPFGNAWIGQVSGETAGYCTSYMVDKYTNADPDEERKFYGNREPPFHTMSKRPAVGASWMAKFGEEALRNSGTVIYKGREVPLPQGYDKFYECEDPEAVKAHRVRKKRAALKVTEEQREKRAEIWKARDKLFSRKMPCG